MMQRVVQSAKNNKKREIKVQKIKKQKMKNRLKKNKREMPG